MKSLELNELLKQHENNYRQSLLDIIQNNTNGLVHQDFVSVFKKPPLDSMDLLRTKLLDLAKKNKTVFQTEKLDSLLEKYRLYLLGCLDEIYKIRVLELSSIVEKKTMKNKKDFIKINKKDFVIINQKIMKLLKERLQEGLQNYILKDFDTLFSTVIEDACKNKIMSDFSKYVSGTYQKQLLENCELKIMVKDTTLMNGVKEQGERYLFTLEHSRLLNETDS